MGTPKLRAAPTNQATRLTSPWRSSPGSFSKK
jgi:hypothetical protein